MRFSSVFGKRLFLISASALGVFSFCFSQKFSGEMAYQNKAVKVDAKSNEWEFPLPLFEPKTRLNFIFSNDAQRIYFTFVANSQITRYKILNAGFVLEIDADGGKKFPVEIAFLPNILGYRPVPKEYKNRTDSLGQMQNWNVPVAIKGKGLKNIPDGLFGTDRHGIEVALIPNDEIDRLFCEVSIPFNLFYKDELKESGLENTFSIRLTVNKIPNENNSLMDDGGRGVSVTGSMNGGVGSRYGGGGYPGSYGGMNGGGMNGGYPNSGGYPNNGMGGYQDQGVEGSVPVSNSNNSELNLKSTFLLKLRPASPPLK